MLEEPFINSVQQQEENTLYTHGLVYFFNPSFTVKPIKKTNIDYKDAKTTLQYQQLVQATEIESQGITTAFYICVLLDLKVLK